jgi:hypothetical protein
VHEPQTFQGLVEAASATACLRAHQSLLGRPALERCRDLPLVQSLGPGSHQRGALVLALAEYKPGRRDRRVKNGARSAAGFGLDMPSHGYRREIARGIVDPLQKYADGGFIPSRLTRVRRPCWTAQPTPMVLRHRQVSAATPSARPATRSRRC